MDLKTLMTADYLDIIFLNRNKSYGGYELRKSYGKRVGKAVAILYSILAGLILYGVLHTAAPAVATVIDKDKGAVVLTEYRPPVAPPVIPPPLPARPVQPQPQAKPRTELFTKPVITNENVPDDKQMAHTDALANAQAGTGHSADGPDVLTDGPDIKPAGGGSILPPEKKNDIPVRWVEQLPEFKGDIVAYLSGQVRYPQAARELNIQGRVVIEFVVNEEGNITNAHVVSGIGGGCDEEALRVINAMPAWKPGRQNGRAVKVYCTVPIVFTLQ